MNLSIKHKKPNSSPPTASIPFYGPILILGFLAGNIRLAAIIVIVGWVFEVLLHAYAFSKALRKYRNRHY